MVGCLLCWNACRLIDVVGLILISNGRINLIGCLAFGCDLVLITNSFGCLLGLMLVLVRVILIVCDLMLFYLLFDLGLFGCWQLFEIGCFGWRLRGFDFEFAVCWFLITVFGCLFDLWFGFVFGVCIGYLV